jgi:hypothetical protein
MDCFPISEEKTSEMRRVVDAIKERSTNVFVIFTASDAIRREVKRRLLSDMSYCVDLDDFKDSSEGDEAASSRTWPHEVAWRLFILAETRQSTVFMSSPNSMLRAYCYKFGYVPVKIEGEGLSFDTQIIAEPTRLSLSYLIASENDQWMGPMNAPLRQERNGISNTARYYAITFRGLAAHYNKVALYSPDQEVLLGAAMAEVSCFLSGSKPTVNMPKSDGLYYGVEIPNMSTCKFPILRGPLGRPDSNERWVGKLIEAPSASGKSYLASLEEAFIDGDDIVDRMLGHQIWEAVSAGGQSEWDARVAIADAIDEHLRSHDDIVLFNGSGLPPTAVVIVDEEEHRLNYLQRRLLEPKRWPSSWDELAENRAYSLAIANHFKRPTFRSFEQAVDWIRSGVPPGPHNQRPDNRRALTILRAPLYLCGADMIVNKTEHYVREINAVEAKTFVIFTGSADEALEVRGRPGWKGSLLVDERPDLGISYAIPWAESLILCTWISPHGLFGSLADKSDYYAWSHEESYEAEGAILSAVVERNRAEKQCVTFAHPDSDLLNWRSSGGVVCAMYRDRRQASLIKPVERSYHWHQMPRYIFRPCEFATALHFRPSGEMATGLDGMIGINPAALVLRTCGIGITDPPLDVTVESWINSQTHVNRLVSTVLRPVYKVDALLLWRLRSTAAVNMFPGIRHDGRISASIYADGKIRPLAISGHAVNMLMASSFDIVDIRRYLDSIIYNLERRKGNRKLLNRYNYYKSQALLAEDSNALKNPLWHTYYEYVVALAAVEKLADAFGTIADPIALAEANAMIEELRREPVFYSDSSQVLQEGLQSRKASPTSVVRAWTQKER